MWSGTFWANKAFKFSYTRHSGGVVAPVCIAYEFILNSRKSEPGSGEETAAAATGHLESHPISKRPYPCPCPCPFRFLFLFQIQIRIHRMYVDLCGNRCVCACWLAPWHVLYARSYIHTYILSDICWHLCKPTRVCAGK